MKHPISRRELLKTTALTGAGFFLGTSCRNRRVIRSPNEKLNLAFIGVGGRGRGNRKQLAGENIVALCDVDDERAGDAYKVTPKAKKFYDYRRMFDAMADSIDAVVISTPDHTHFHPAHAAMQLGKHVYVEKPLAHSVWEVRTLTEAARKYKVATQLGAQRHALENVHRVVEIIQAGVIGTVDECHAWIGEDRGMPAVPNEFPPAPKHMKWDLWLGPARARRYSPAYAPYNWRFWWDFGTAETGNWGCHILDIPFWALGLDFPTHVESTGPPVDAERTPKRMTTHFEFPARGNRPRVKLSWYHTAKGPDVLRDNGLPYHDLGVLFVGTKGMLLCDFGSRRLFPEERFKDFTPPKPSIPDSPGFWVEWLDACRGGPPATCHFDYSGPLTETVLLSNLAYRAGEAFEWDAKNLRPRGKHPNAEALIRPPYRNGWS